MLIPLAIPGSPLLPQNIPLALVIMVISSMLFATSATIQHLAVGREVDTSTKERHMGVGQVLEGIVPRGDDGDDALGVVVNVNPGQQREESRAPLGAQDAGGMHAVVAGGHGDVEDLLDRVAAGLAGLRDDDVGELRLVSEEEIVEREQEASAGGGAECGPGRLGAASRGERGVEVGVGGLRDAGERCAIQGGHGGSRLGRGGTHPGQ